MTKPLRLNLQFFSEEDAGGYAAIPDEHFDGLFEEADETDSTSVDEVDDNLPPTSEEIDDETLAPDEVSGDEETEVPTDTYKVKADGVEHDLTLDELIQNASAGMNYTQKLQRLQQDVEQQYEPYIQLGNTLADHPKLREIVQQAASQYFSEEQTSSPEQLTDTPSLDLNQDPRFQAMQQQLQQQQSFIQNFQQQQQQEAMRKEWTDLTDRYPDAKELQQQIIDLADSKPGIDLEMAYRHLTYENVAKRTQEETAKNALKKSTARTLGANKGTGGQESLPKPKSYADVWKHIERSGQVPDFNS